MFGCRRGTTERPGPDWSREKMLALLAGTGVVAALLVVGLVLAVVHAVHPAAHQRGARGSHVSGQMSPDRGSPATGPNRPTDRRDALAAEPMPRVDSSASRPGPVSIADPGVLTVLPATGTGPAQVPTGFPHTPAGALAQLAAIDQTALQSGSLTGARAVIHAWATPGGPTGSRWSLIRGLAQLLGEMGLSGGGSSRLAIVLTPLMGQIKGSVGPDFVIPCIDFELDLTLNQTARGATADCQRMLWRPDQTSPRSGRWMIGPGSEPATPPSVWPDTDLAIAVGYHDLRPEPEHG